MAATASYVAWPVFQMFRALHGGPLVGQEPPKPDLAVSLSTGSQNPGPYLDQRSVDVGLLEQEDVIRAVVEPFNAVSGCFEDSWVIGLDSFGKSWLYM